jgi:hypothetical protein
MSPSDNLIKLRSREVHFKNCCGDAMATTQIIESLSRHHAILNIIFSFNASLNVMRNNKAQASLNCGENLNILNMRVLSERSHSKIVTSKLESPNTAMTNHTTQLTKKFP